MDRAGSGNAAGQSRSGESAVGDWFVFRIQVQNDGSVADKFYIDADGAQVQGYRVKFMRSTTEITSAVVGGTYQTRWLLPGERATIEGWVKTMSGAAQGSSVTRLVTLTSIADPSKVDAVRFAVSRRN